MEVVNVTKDNFRETFGRFKLDLKECNFVSIDTEFSGLHETVVDGFSLFDTPGERYKKMIYHPIKIMQVGIALFKFDGSKNEWSPRCYNFTVFPVTFDALCMSEKILCQASGLRFLRQHNFDFNKWISDGIPYLNARAVSSVRRYLRSRRSILKNGSPLDKGTLSVTRVSQETLNEKTRTNALSDEDIEDMLDDLKGFSHVIEHLSKSKKIIVGHNAFVDLFLISQEFCDDLPATFEEFKAKLLRLFPQIIDTKRLAHAIKEELPKVEHGKVTPFDVTVLNDTNLFALHLSTQLKEPFSPKVCSPPEYKSVLEQAAKQRIESIPSTLCHDAAFDACVTGCVFIQLAYLVQRPTLQFSSLHATARELFFGCSRWFNVLNATRCTVPYIRLQGEDPVTHRPDHIVVVGHKKGFNLRSQIEKLHRDLPKFGDYDLKFQDGDTIIIACGNIGCHRGVRTYLGKEGFIVKDRSWIWSKLMEPRTCLRMTGVIVVTGTVLYGIRRLFFSTPAVQRVSV